MCRGEIARARTETRKQASVMMVINAVGRDPSVFMNTRIRILLNVKQTYASTKNRKTVPDVHVARDAWTSAYQALFV